MAIRLHLLVQPLFGPSTADFSTPMFLKRERANQPASGVQVVLPAGRLCLAILDFAPAEAVPPHSLGIRADWTISVGVRSEVNAGVSGSTVGKLAPDPSRRLQGTQNLELVLPE